MAANPPPVPPPATGVDQWIREALTALIALSVAAISLVMLVETFNAAKAPTTTSLQQQKDILLYGLSLFGTVLGYYFGRVPAELHAQQAKASEARAVTAAADLSAQVRAALPRTITAIEGMLARQGAAALAAAAGPQDTLTPALTDLKALMLRVGG